MQPSNAGNFREAIGAITREVNAQFWDAYADIKAKIQATGFDGLAVAAQQKVEGILDPADPHAMRRIADVFAVPKGIYGQSAVKLEAARLSSLADSALYAQQLAGNITPLMTAYARGFDGLAGACSDSEKLGELTAQLKLHAVRLMKTTMNPHSLAGAQNGESKGIMSMIGRNEPPQALVAALQSARTDIDSPRLAKLIIAKFDEQFCEAVRQAAGMPAPELGVKR